MYDDPEIVRQLRKEEQIGMFKADSEENFSEVDPQDDFSEESIESTLLIDSDENTDNVDNNYEGSIDLENISDVETKTLLKQLKKLQKKNDELLVKLEESNNRYNSLAEYFEIISDTTIALGKKDLFSDVNDIIFQTTPNGRITYINTAVEKVAKYNSSELIGDSLSKILSHKDWKKIRKMVFSKFDKKDIMAREINSFETFIITKNGERVPVEVNGKLIRHNVEVMGRKNEVRLQGSIRDITERKEAEKERVENAIRLEKMNGELQSINNLLFNTNEELSETKDELEVLNKGLETKVEERTAEIEKLLKQKDDFIGQLGHDLKSPLTPLVGLLPTIESEEKDPKLKELLSVVNRNVIYMRDLVVKTLKLEKLNLPNLKLVLEPINLCNLTESAIKNKEFYTKEKNLEIKNNVGKKIMINGDKLQLDELFDNLLVNAIKFTPENGFIAFDAEENKDFIKVTIKDSGIGMTAEEIENVFVEFYKVDPSRHDLESSGLGLPICKRIVEKHGGKIWVESAGHGKGSTFSFTIPKK